MKLRTMLVFLLAFSLLILAACSKNEAPISNPAPSLSSSEETLSESLGNPTVFSATETDEHGGTYTELNFGEIALSLNNEPLVGLNVELLDNDMQAVPDWGYYANCPLDQQEKLEDTTFHDNGDPYVQRSTRYYYLGDDDLIEKQTFAYLRVLREAGWEMERAAPWGVNYSKNGWYINLSQDHNRMIHRLCITISDFMWGL